VIGTRLMRRELIVQVLLLGMDGATWRVFEKNVRLF
jgi:hypothetical protein